MTNAPSFVEPNCPCRLTREAGYACAQSNGGWTCLWW